MKLYVLTAEGRKATKYVSDDSDGLRALNFIADRGEVSGDELETVATRGTIRSLKKGRLIKEVTA